MTNETRQAKPSNKYDEERGYALELAEQLTRKFGVPFYTTDSAGGDLLFTRESARILLDIKLAASEQ